MADLPDPNGEVVRWIVGTADGNGDADSPPGETLRTLIELAPTDPTLELVRTIGLPDRPQLVVLEMTEARAERLREAFPRLRVERDRPLEPL